MNAGTYDEENKMWTMTFPGQEWYSVQEVSNILQVGGPTVYSAVNRGSITAYKVGGTTKIKHDDLMEYIQRRGRRETKAAHADSLIEKIVPSDKSKEKAGDMADDVVAEGNEPQAKIQLDLFDDDDE